MQITSRDNTQFDVKTKDTVVQCGRDLTIGTFILPGPGEYEIGGVMAESTDVATRLYVEDFVIGHLKMRTNKLTDHELEELGAVDVLIFPIGSEGLKEKEAASLIAQVEAPIMLPLATDADSLALFCKDNVRCENVAGPLKLSKSQLPSEGSRIIVFDQGAK